MIYFVLWPLHVLWNEGQGFMPWGSWNLTDERTVLPRLENCWTKSNLETSQMACNAIVCWTLYYDQKKSKLRITVPFWWHRWPDRCPPPPPPPPHKIRPWVIMTCGKMLHGPLTRCVKLRVAHAPGMPGTFSPPPRIGGTDMHHGTCATHVPWCMPRSLISDFLWSWWRGKRSGIPRTCATRHFTYVVRGP